MKKTLKKLLSVLALGLLTSIWAVAAIGATNPPSTQVSKQFYKDNAAAIKAIGGKLSPNVACKNTAEKTVFLCTFKGTNTAGKPLCAQTYVAYRPGYHTIPWNPSWKCGRRAIPLPPAPPLSLFHRINNETFTGPGA